MEGRGCQEKAGLLWGRGGGGRVKGAPESPVGPQALMLLPTHSGSMALTHRAAAEA